MPDLIQVLQSAGLDVSELGPLFSTGRSDSLCLPVPGGDAAVDAWRRLRAAVETTRHWPVLLGEVGEAMGAAEEASERGPPVAAILDAASRIDGGAVFEKWRTTRLEEYKTYNPDEDLNGFSAPEGDWPDEAEPRDGFITPFDILTRRPHKRVLIGLVPTTVAWEVPAHLNIGGWNACPPPEEHCAAMASWHHRYGAEIVAATRDVIEMHVARPPWTREAAMSLARDQYAYCEDIVDQGTRTVSHLAAGLLGGTTWYFWWD